MEKRWLSGTVRFTVSIVRAIGNLGITIIKGMGALAFALVVFEITVVTVKRILKAFEGRRS